MTECVFCGSKISDDALTVKLTQKGCKGILRASEQRNTVISVFPGQLVHEECRKQFTNPRKLQQYKNKQQKVQVGCKRRSSAPSFSYKDHCLFCGVHDRYAGKKKEFILIPVRTKDFQTKLLECCHNRSDHWSDIVTGRLAYVNDLHAADAVYHKSCNSNFRTGRQIPKYFQNENSDGSKRHRAGRPESLSHTDAFLQVVQDLRHSDNEQTTINDLIIMMKGYLKEDDEPYSFAYMKKRLQSHFGDELLISVVKGKKNVVTFQKTVTSILHEFHDGSKKDDKDKDRLIMAAAEILKTDIRSVEQENNFYPNSIEMSSLQKTLEFVPQSLQLFLRTLFTGKDKDLKVSSLGQAMMQATRRRGLLPPLQLGLGVQMHHHFASKFLVDSLHNLGFSCSYSEVQMYERSAAVAQKLDLCGFTPGHFMQYVADNADHNVQTIDGHGTFHGMGIIACVTPKIQHASIIPRIKVTAKDIADVGQINIVPYVQRSGGLKHLTYSESEEPSEGDRETTADRLWKLSLVLGKGSRPAWSGMMKMLNSGDHPGQSSVIFLPMIDMDPGDLTCIYSTLHFVCSHAVRYGVTPILTFDQPLWWKAMSIIESEASDSPLKSIILRLGGFHVLMSFLGAIGYLMSGSGLEGILELVYAPNTVPKMLEGKAIARAIRGHFLVDGALNTLLAAKTFQIDLPIPSSAVDIENLSEGTEDGTIACQVEDSEAAPDETVSDLQEETFMDQIKDLPPELVEASNFYDIIMNSTVGTDESEILNIIAQRLEAERTNLKHDRTAVLWLQYMEMIDLVRAFIRSERTGNWDLHLDVLTSMMSYMAASGHNMYAKSLNIYLQKMRQLRQTNPQVYQRFHDDGLHVVRRSDEYWAGLSPDLVIEQVLMRGMKSTGGLTRGKGMSETQRLVWVLSNPTTSNINSAMQELTMVNYGTSEQHKDLSASRQARDYADTVKILNFLGSHNPFAGSENLQHLITGVMAEDEVNVDQSKEVGRRILEGMVGKKVTEYTFKKKARAVNMDSKSSIKLNNGENVHIDPLLLFQRLVIAGTQTDMLAEAFKYELCGYPPALFETKTVLLPANKPQMAKAIWNAVPHDFVPKGEILYVLDGGALLHRLPWEIGKTYGTIVEGYIHYVQKHYGQSVVIVFDGYSNQPSTKDGTHKRRNGKTGRKVLFFPSMTLTLKKQEFLANNENKQRFINLLGEGLELAGFQVHNAQGDADVLIAKTAVMGALNHKTVLVGDDTDLLILLLYHFQEGELYFMSEPKKLSSSGRRFLNIGHARDVLGDDVSSNILFAHAILGCDTTSRVYGIGKGVALRLIQENDSFRAHARLFKKQLASKDEIAAAGESAMMIIYKGGKTDSLNDLRLKHFYTKVTDSKTAIHPRNLPPTSSSAMYHSLRVYHQVQEWMGNSLPPNEWGWKFQDSCLIPVHSDQDPAPQCLLEMVRCHCKSGCGTMRCKCRRQGLDCSLACSECRGVCVNMQTQHSDHSWSSVL